MRRTEREKRDLLKRLVYSARKNTATVYIPERGWVDIKLPPINGGRL